MAEGFMFWLLAIAMIAASLMVVTTRNLVHSVMSAFIVLGATAGLYFMLNAEFLGVVQVLIYAGAVTILVLFVVMLTTAGPNYEIPAEAGPRVLFGVFSALFMGLLFFIITSTRWPVGAMQASNVTKTLATRIFVDYLLPFEVASILLLVALIGAVVLARRD